MAKARTKKRTHVAAKNPANGAAKPNLSTPKSMVIRMNPSTVGASVSQLVTDMRDVMAPHTALRLKERRNNRLRDFTTMAGPLGVTHMLVFSKSESGNTNLRICTTPRGPTLSFRVEKYSLCKDVQRTMKRPRGREEEDFINPPLLLMNNFQQSGKGEANGRSSTTQTNPISKQLEDLTTTVFRSMFPPITPQSTPLHSVKRVLLLDRVTKDSPADSADSPFILHLRHYAISTRIAGLPRSLKRLSTQNIKHGKNLPNLGKLSDVSEYLLDPSAAGYTSASETEVDTDAEVEVIAPTARKIIDKKAKQKESKSAKQPHNNVEKRAVKMVELGPRMTLRLMKIEEGLAGGKVLWHESIKKSREEEREQDELWEQRRREKEERRRIQKENVERKKKEKGGKGGEGEDEDEDEDMEYFSEDQWEDEDDEGEDEVEVEHEIDQEGEDKDEDMEDEE